MHMLEDLLRAGQSEDVDNRALIAELASDCRMMQVFFFPSKFTTVCFPKFCSNKFLEWLNFLCG